VALLFIAGLVLSVSAQAQDAAPVSALDLIFGNSIIALFAIVALGMLLGKVRFFGLSLGNSGVIFTALLFGYWGYAIPANIGTLGLVLFVYCVGLNAGPAFFRAFVEQGATLAQLSVLLVIVGGATTVVLAKLLNVPADLAVGVFAGAMTSTPALAAAMDALGPEAAVSIGYGIAYPFGVVGVVLFVQLLPRLLRVDLDEEAKKAANTGAQTPRIERMLIEIRNPSLFGKKINEVQFLRASGCRISRMLLDEKMVPIKSDLVFEEGLCVLAVGATQQLETLAEFLGKKSSRTYVLDVEGQRMKIVASSNKIVGRTLHDIDPLGKFGVTITRIERNSVGFVPRSDLQIHRADIMIGVGESKNLQKFSVFAGHQMRVVDETDLISLMVGLIAGMVLGMVPIGLPGTTSFSLGLAGGPLLVGLLMGHFGRIGALRGHIPRAARYLISEIGLVFFLAGAGVKAGGRFLDVLQAYGMALPLMGLLATSLPMICGYLVARHLLKLPLLQILGGVCGGMTSTPGLGVLSGKTDSQAPAISYAAAYPVALILMALMAQIIVSLLS
jgi:putative transport protein